MTCRCGAEFNNMELIEPSIPSQTTSLHRIATALERLADLLTPPPETLVTALNRDPNQPPTCHQQQRTVR